MCRLLRCHVLQRLPTLNTTHTHCYSHVWTISVAAQMNDNADEGSFLELTGFSRSSFALLLQVLFPNPTPQTFARPVF